MPSTRAYGQTSWLDKITLVFKVLPLPIVTLYRLLVSPFNNDRYKGWRRVATDATFRYVSSRLKVNQMQSIMGTTLQVYERWARENGMEAIVDEIGDDARLMWFGKRSTERVILYIHGGVYCLPMQDFGASYWRSTCRKLEAEVSNDFGFAALNYSLIPTAHFPAQLKQLVLAVQYLLSTGVQPGNIHLVGESAGGALILQLISHLLHPLNDVPTLPEGIRFGGTCLLSPWVSLTGDTGSFQENSDADALPASTWAYLGTQTLAVTSQEYQSYLEASKAPQSWFVGAENVVSSVLLVVGEKECLRDDVLRVGELLEGEGSQPGFVTAVVQDHGVHNDLYLDFLAGQAARPGDGTSETIASWFKERLSA